MRSKRGVTLGYLLMITVSSASPLQTASAIDRSDGRALQLQRDLRSVRSRIERAPRASSSDLENLQRQLHDRRVDEPSDASQDFEIELGRLRAKADRSAGRPVIVMLPRTSPLAVHAPIEQPGHPGGGYAAAAAPPAPSYFGRRLVLLQRAVATIERRLAQRDTAAAARLLEAARGDLATLRRVFDSAVAEDPNIAALDAQIRALEDQLTGR